MGAFLATLALPVLLGAVAPAPLESHVLPQRLLTLLPDASINFDLYDLRNEPEPEHLETDPHSIFRLKTHLGIAAGYDNAIFHTSVGCYITVAEWGRWTFGTTSPEIGFGRYHVYDPRRRQSIARTQSTLLISLASVHLRGGTLRSINKNWYVNFEQIFDARANFTGSQIGLSFANP